MLIESPAFEAQQTIPSQYSCDGENLSPPLRFLQIPQGAKSFVLIMEDPDTSKGTFDHWIIWNIPAHVTELTEGAPELKRLTPVPAQGKNSEHKAAYTGPCPPKGESHRYFFELYALDTQLSLPEGSAKKDVQRAMEGHILDHAELMGRFQH